MSAWWLLLIVPVWIGAASFLAARLIAFCQDEVPEPWGFPLYMAGASFLLGAFVLTPIILILNHTTGAPA
jgi:hypothetical protein